ncbi:hypothetical protein P8452_34863 [Trifolium repens]|nr:hypothetical protein P8452_34863 [Trifolium repens]
MTNKKNNLKPQKTKHNTRENTHNNKQEQVKRQKKKNGVISIFGKIKHIEMKNYGGQTKIVVGYGTKLFGRKGILSRLDEGAFLDSGKVDSVGEVTNEYQSNDDREKEVHLMDEVESFHDENGVPPDSNDENISTFSNVNWLKKIDIYEVTYGVENEVEMHLEGSINDTTADEGINTGITTHVDTSGLQSRNRWR